MAKPDLTTFVEAYAVRLPAYLPDNMKTQETEIIAALRRDGDTFDLVETAGLDSLDILDLSFDVSKALAIRINDEARSRIGDLYASVPDDSDL